MHKGDWFQYRHKPRREPRRSEPLKGCRPSVLHFVRSALSRSASPSRSFPAWAQNWPDRERVRSKYPIHKSRREWCASWIRIYDQLHQGPQAILVSNYDD